MAGPSSERSILQWFWTIEYLASSPQVPTATLYYLITEAPPLPDDLKGKVDELVALRCLEELSRVGYVALGEKVDIDLSKTCRDVLECILQEASVSDIMTRTKPLQWDIKPFVLHKRAAMPKTSLQQLKDAILEGSYPIDSSLKKMSGLNFNGQQGQDKSEFLLPTKKRKMACNLDSENLADNLHEGQQTLDDIAHFTDNQLKQFLHEAFESAAVNESGKPDDVEKVVSVEDDQMAIKEKSGDYANPTKNSDNGSEHRNPTIMDASGSKENAANAFLSAEPPEHNLDMGILENKEPSSGRDANQDEEIDITMKNSDNGSEHRNPIITDASGSIKTAANGHLSAYHNLDMGILEEKQPSSSRDVNPDEEIDITMKNSDNGSEHRNPIVTDASGSIKTAANGYLSADHNLDMGILEDKQPSSSRDVNPDEEIDITMKNSDNGSEHRNPIVTDASGSIKTAANGHLSADHNLDMGILEEKQPSSSIDVNPDEEIGSTMKKSDFLRSYPQMGDSLFTYDWTARNVCVKCNESGQTLVCKQESCSLEVHEKCLGISVTFDEAGNFYCPLCCCSTAAKEYRESRKEESLLKKDMAGFMV